MARSARDCALMLNAMAGYHISDACAVDEPVVDWVAALNGDLSGLRIGLDTLAGRYAAADGGVTALLESAVVVLEELGATVVPVQLPLYDELSAATRITSRSEALAYHLPDLQVRWEDYFAATRRGVGSAAFYTGADYVQAQRVRRVGQQAVAELMTGLDAVITPTASVGGFTVDSLADPSLDLMGAIHTGYWNAVGNPALSVPMGFGESGLPLGLQVVGRPFDEATALRIGDAYQQVTDWHLARPELLTATAGAAQGVPVAAG